MAEGEVTISYVEGNQSRVVRGVVRSEDENGFLILERRDGVIKINRSFIIKIESAKGGDDRD